MKVLFTGGGTAGHINPALAAAGYLLQKEPDAQILYVGNKGGMEERLVPQAGYEIRTVHISGFQRKLTPKNLWRNAQTVVRVFTATAEAKRIIQEFAPDVCDPLRDPRVQRLSRRHHQDAGKVGENRDAGRARRKKVF